MQVKYSLQTLNTALPEGFHLDNQTFVAKKEIIDLFKANGISHWQTWIGSTKMSEIRSMNSFLVTWMPSSTPGWLNAENETLSKRLEHSWYSLLLSAKNFSEWGASQCFTGSATLENSHVTPKEIKSYSERPILEQPFYQSVDQFYEDESRIFVEDQAQPLLDDWKMLHNALCEIHQKRRVNAALRDAFESLLAGRTTSEPATAIARFVEASEAIIGLPKRNGGRDVFAQRARLFLSNVVNDNFLNWDETELIAQLVKIYEIRNNRNHGKGMSSQILGVYGISDDDEGAQEKINIAGAKSSYLAENLAKETIKYIVLNPEKLAIAGDRSKLEESWARGEFYNKA